MARKGPQEEAPAAEAMAEPLVIKQLAVTWAAAKGMADRFLANSGTFAVPNPEFLKFAQARAFAAWADDQQITEAEFDAAVAAANNCTFR
jgi:hypothetical protein